ncbi:type II toxin-antitoxin system MqsA family antitoxin [Desulfonatronospira sp. MSAO_Bac3]|uniref:type II toxin-antitoxin system MqsA family antitoxin n=1 Tax=Desulfonatronospira sp. MSAO_Bac3 TaxID=2293857 RepID=UPI000FEF74B5|nr:type II toxin-antitoxin system MqsA family antitoxin [Desulfonatronospira sp. MSAO_Bac3]RQD78506.1 MAG: type II toxin-antitoxin system MqsA family antitoxin [Desulfonatronospira sp. MSAO_Bac3]
MEHCYFCKTGVLEDKYVTVDFRWGDQLIIIEKVPAKICNECGERYYSANISRKMEDIAINQKADRMIEIPLAKLSFESTNAV